MDYGKTKTVFSLTMLTFCAIVLSFSSPAFAQTSNQVIPSQPGPNVPGTPNTISQYCSSGICVVNGTAPLNFTQGFFRYGNYTGGIPVSNSSLISIQLSQACQIMEKNHIPNHCLTYKQLQMFDNTNPVYTGEWVNDTWYHRSPPMTKQSWNFVMGKTVVMVDPDSDFTAKARNIIVMDGNFTYINPAENVTNHVRIEFHNRFVSSDCSQAWVYPNLWLVNDTLAYLESGCTVTHYFGQSFVSTPVYANLWNTWEVRQNQYLSQFSNATKVTENCITNQCEKFSSIYHNHDPKFGW